MFQPLTINQDTMSSTFAYTPGRARWKQVANYGAVTETTVYVGGLMEKVTRGAVTEYRHYLPAGSGSMAIHTRRSGGSPASSTYYVTGDHLGSATAVMDGSGAALVNLSFAAFGSRRGAAWQDQPLPGDWTQITATTRRGFTGHEHLDNLSLVHMNGRVYDPKIGRFLSADPVYVGSLAEPQSLNPYSYVSNNPLTMVDPSGFSGALLATGGPVLPPLPPPPPPSASAPCPSPVCILVNGRTVGLEPSTSISSRGVATSTLAFAVDYSNSTGYNNLANWAGRVGPAVRREYMPGIQQPGPPAPSPPASGPPASENGADGRALTGNEVTEAQSVFGDRIDYSKVRIIDDKYVFTQGSGYVMAPDGNIYWPGECGDLVTCNGGASAGTFIHEMTHVMQHQRGVNVLGHGLLLQAGRFLSFGLYDPYSFTYDQSRSFRSYNIEQQGDIARGIYYGRYPNNIDY